MDEPLAIGTVLIIVVTSLCSFIGFRDPAFRDRYLFSVGEILAGKEHHRLFTSGFLHADLRHLAGNMVSLYLFGRPIEQLLGTGPFLLIYFAAIIGGDLLSLWVHRHHEYRAYGASGGVCGIIFSYIFLFPASGISLFMLPILIPAWLYAILFFVFSFVAMKQQLGNVGHDAHLGGAIIGLLITTALRPDIVGEQPKLFATILGLSVLLFLYLAKNPLFLPLENLLPSWPRSKRKPDRMPAYRRENLELDAVLDKISKHGIESLKPEEKALLNSVSGKYQRRADSQKPGSDLII